jgi:hypothetical protein
MTQGSARAIADLTGGIILAEVEIAAPAERVFRALTESSEVVRWWGSPDAYRTESWTADLRPGGALAGRRPRRRRRRIPRRRDLCGRRAARPTRADLARRLGRGPETTLTYQLAPRTAGRGSRFVTRGSPAGPESCRAHSSGWELVLGWLSRHFAALGGRSLRALLPLPPPAAAPELPVRHDRRGGFGHAGARGLLDRKPAPGTAIVFGPVADPKGAWVSAWCGSRAKSSSGPSKPPIRPSKPQGLSVRGAPDAAGGRHA